jgi:hypothetical protein
MNTTNTATAEAAVDRAAAKSIKLDRAAKKLAKVAAEAVDFADRVFPGGRDAALARAAEAITKRDEAVAAAAAAEAAYERAEARFAATKRAAT